MDRIKVFISSNINEELKPIRNKLGKLIERTGFASAYVYEKSGASSFKNDESYLFELSRSDVMILLIDKMDKIGVGTQREFDYSMAHSIKILAIFCNEFSDQQTEIEKKIIDASYCKFMTVNKRSDMISAAFESFISDVANYYIRYKDSKNNELEENNYFSNSQIIHKDFLPEFKYTRSTLLNIIYGVKINNEENNGTDYLFSEFLKVLLYKKKFSETQFDELKALIVLKQTKVLKKPIELRLDSIKQYFLNDITKSIQILQSIELESKQIPNWFKLDKLIDERNLIILQRPFNVDNEAQKKIDENLEFTYVPVLDRLRSNIEGYISKIYQEKDYESPYSSSFHNIEHIYNDLSSYFCSSLIYGSLTHLLIFRDLLIRLLVALYNNQREIRTFLALYNLLLKGNKGKELDLILDKTPETYFNFLSSDIIWKSFSNISEIRYIDQIKLLFIRYNAFYLSPDVLNECADYYYDFIQTKAWKNVFLRNNKIVSQSFRSLALMVEDGAIEFVSKLLSSNDDKLICYALEFIHYLPKDKMKISDFEKINQNLEKILTTENIKLIEDKIRIIGEYYYDSKRRSPKLLKFIKINFKNYYNNELIIDLSSNEGLLKSKFINECNVIKTRIENNGNILIGTDYFNLILFLLRTKKVTLTISEYKNLIDLSLKVLESSSFNYDQKASALLTLIFIGNLYRTNLTNYIKQHTINTNALLNSNRDNIFDKTSHITLKFLYNFLNLIVGQTKDDGQFLMMCSLHDGTDYDKISCLNKLFCNLSDNFYLGRNEASVLLYNLAFDLAQSPTEDIRYYSVCILFRYLNKDNKVHIKRRIEYIFDSSNMFVKLLIINKILKLKKYRKIFDSVLARAKATSNNYISSSVPIGCLRSFCK